MERGKIETAINGGLTVCEYREGIRFGTDAFLLAAFARERIGYGLCADFGTGSGVLPLLLLSSGCKADFLAVEVQGKYAALAKENAEKNGFSDRVEILHGDLREYRGLLQAGSCAYVVSNPPYLPTDCGRKNLAEEKRIAWHEDLLNADELAGAAAWALQSGGKFFCVYLPSRMAGLLYALKSHALEPKRLRFVASHAGEAPSLLLVEAKKDAAEGLTLLPTLYLFGDAAHREESEELKELYGRFGEKSRR